MEQTLNKTKTVSWSLYDWAQSAFSTTVVAGFFPVFFKEYWSAGSDAAVSTLQLGAAHSLSSLLLALVAPLLGAMADRGQAKTRFLMLFTALGVGGTGALFFIERGAWVEAAALFVCASFAYAATNIFYDALLVDVATDANAHFVSSLGYALGYLGGGILFAFNIWMLFAPASFGLADKAEAIRWSFVSVALWWALFSLPLFLHLRDPRPRVRTALLQTARASLAELWRTAHAIRRLRTVWMFLLAYWLYIDGVGTIVRMAVDYGIGIGFDSSQLLAALLITQFVAFPAALALGKFAQWRGAKRAIFLCIAGYIAISLWAMQITHTWEFYGVATAIGLVQGGIQALSRSFYARLIPAQNAGEFFGFYNMLGKFAAILGPILMGAIGVATGSPRLSLLALVILFVAGAVLLYFVDDTEVAAKAGAH